jgi:two-component system LytT family response regulator
VDDEAPSREVMSNYLRDYCSDIEVVATASSVKSAYRAIQKYNPEVVFLDIEMPDGKGFDLLKMFDKINFRIIFVTAYSDYAINAFRVNAVDYLLKPVKIDELVAAVEKIRKENKWNHETDSVAVLLKNLTESLTLQPVIVVSNVKGFEVLKIDEIIMCKADGYCTNFYMEGSRKVVSSRNLKQYEELLSSNNIIRVHHSYMINLRHVQSYTRQGEIFLTENNKASLGDSFKSSFLQKFSRK